MRGCLNEHLLRRQEIDTVISTHKSVHVILQRYPSTNCQHQNFWTETAMLPHWCSHHERLQVPSLAHAVMGQLTALEEERWWRTLSLHCRWGHPSFWWLPHWLTTH